MNILDAVIIIAIILGFIDGYRKGVIGSVVSLIGTILIFLLAFYLKNPIAEFFYTYLPFNPFKLFGDYIIFNILLYEALAFLIVFAILFAIFKVILKVTKLVEKVLKLTIIFGFISKLLGGILGIIESYIIVYLLLFVFSQPFINITGIDNSKLADTIMTKTPILTNVTKDINEASDKINDLKISYKGKDMDKFNYESMDILLKYDIISIDSTKKLQEKDKLNIKDLDKLINKYGG